MTAAEIFSPFVLIENVAFFGSCEKWEGGGGGLSDAAHVSRFRA